jgi:hypothetical protein
MKPSEEIKECDHLYSLKDLLGKCVKCGKQFKFIKVITPTEPKDE